MKKLLCFIFFSTFLFSAVFTQSVVKKSESENENLKQGCEAYKNEDWLSAIFFLRKVVSLPGSASDENIFMLIKSELYAGEYQQAHADCERFLEQFSFSPYREYIQYQNGRILHLLARNEDAVLALSDFCHQNPESDLYPLALFWIAECFYDEYNFDNARGLYQRVVSDYPACERAPNAQYKLDLIERREREEKLLYLLKVIGEENLSTREEYERQLRVYQLEDQLGVKKELIDAQARIAELEALLEEAGGLVYVYDDADTAGTDDTVKNSVSQTESAKSEVSSKNKSSDNAAQTSSSQASANQNKPVNIIQNVNESSIRVKSGSAKSANKSKTTGSEAELQALKRKSKQLQYLIEDQAE
ncbi:tetratricopeptide repeat protein [Treponema sp.]|uniref:tetratricopeptide repeat protein n=1 Tax=Treponema sp. TaxID=166 RepID=UPI003890F382